MTLEFYNCQGCIIKLNIMVCLTISQNVVKTEYFFTSLQTKGINVGGN